MLEELKLLSTPLARGGQGELKHEHEPPVIMLALSSSAGTWMEQLDFHESGSVGLCGQGVAAASSEPSRGRMEGALP